MSQVVVTEDSYGQARERTLQQERKISCDDDFARFRKTDVTKIIPFLRLIFAPIVLPVVLIFSVFTACMGAVVGIVGTIMRVLGKMLPGKPGGI